MSIAQSRSSKEIVHIRSDSPARGALNPAIQAFEEMLVSASLEAEVFTDVYRALAAICTPAPPGEQEAGQRRAVFVCVDDLGQAELEFFVVMGRTRPDLPVYVYGMEHLASRVDKAVDFGATGRVTGGVIHSLADTEVLHPGEAPESAVQQEAATVSSPPPAQPAQTDEAHLLAADAPPAEETEVCVDEDSATGPARVPWLRYADGPTRCAPQRPAPAPPEASLGHLEDPANDRQQAAEPLLTDAELRALIGEDLDDIAAIAPEERREAGFDGSNEGQGRA